MTRFVLRLVFISDRSITSSSVHFSYKNHSLLLSFLYFSQKHIFRACSSYLSEICRSIPTSLVLIRSLFGSVSNFFPFLRLFFIFHFPFETLYLVFVPPSVLGSVTTCRQCLVRQVISHSSLTGRVMKKCTRWVIEIQTI